MAEPRSPRVLLLVSEDAEAAILTAIAASAGQHPTAEVGGLRLPASVVSGSFALPARGEVIAGLPPERGFLRVGPIEIDTRARVVTLAGQPLELTRREYELLSHLASAPGRVFTKRELLDFLWREPVGSSTRRLDTLVARLRRRLGEHRALLVTVWGVGYRLG